MKTETVRILTPNYFSGNNLYYISLYIKMKEVQLFFKVLLLCLFLSLLMMMMIIITNTGYHLRVSNITNKAYFFKVICIFTSRYFTVLNKFIQLNVSYQIIKISQLISYRSSSLWRMQTNNEEFCNSIKILKKQKTKSVLSDSDE